MPIKFVLKHNLPAETTNIPQLAEFNFDGNMFTVGSSPESNLVLSGLLPEEIVILREADRLRLINAGEATRLNKKRLPRDAMVPLSVGDKIKIGNYSILVTDGELSEIAPIPKPNKDFPITKPSSPLPVIIAPLAEETRQESNEFNSVENVFEDRANEPPKPSRNFAEVLDTLRTDDDSFYFTVKQGERETGKIMLSQPETPLGLDERGTPVTGSQIKTFLAVAKKNWSGISIESPEKKFVTVNKESLKSNRRLHHEDVVVLTSAPKFSLVLHEPGALVALESILSARKDKEVLHEEAVSDEPGSKKTSGKVKKQPIIERKYFKHFSFIEIIAMFIATLIGAVITFLILEFAVS